MFRVFPSSVVPQTGGAVMPTSIPTAGDVFAAAAKAGPQGPVGAGDPHPARTAATATIATRRTAGRFGRERVVEPPYLTVMVPVMFAWTSHTNEYVPAASAGTW